MTKTVVALYDDYDAGQEAVRDLVNQGFRRDDISFVAGDGKRQHAEGIHGSDAGADAAAGARVGAALGGLAGLLVGLGALAIPGVGPIIAAGPLAATLAGAGVGAITGGLAGALADAGVDRNDAQTFAEGVRRGGTLVTVQAPDQRAGQAREVLNRHGAADIQSRVTEWRQSGWAGPDSAENDDAFDFTDEEGAGRQGSIYSTSPTEVDERIGPEQTDPGYGDVAAGNMPHDAAGYLPGEHTNQTFSGGEASASGAGATGDRPAPEQAQAVPTHGSTPDAAPGRPGPVSARDYDSFEGDLRANHELLYAGQSYERYRPAYRYGYDLAGDSRFRGRSWREIEPDARREWEQRYPNEPWDNVSAAVRHAWEVVSTASTPGRTNEPGSMGGWSGRDPRAQRGSYQGPEDRRI